MDRLCKVSNSRVKVMQLLVRRSSRSTLAKQVKGDDLEVQSKVSHHLVEDCCAALETMDQYYFR